MTLFRRRLARTMRTSGRSATIPSPAVRSGRSTGASSSRSPIVAIVCSRPTRILGSSLRAAHDDDFAHIRDGRGRIQHQT
jgi:hypothetical protein